MSGTVDTYTLKLIDQILGPMKAILAQAEKTNEILLRMEKLCGGGLGMMKLSSHIQQTASHFNLLTSSAGTALSMLGRMGSAVEGVVAGFGKGIISATGFREKYIGMLTNQLGEKPGKDYYKKLLGIANLTPGTAAELMENASHLVNIGFRGNLLDAATAGAADVQAMMGNQKAEQFTRGISDMFSKLKMEEGDFKQAFGGILDMGMAEEAILRLKGINVAASKVHETFEKLHKSGQITGKEGVIGGMQALEQHVDHGKGLGSLAKQRGVGSLEGLISNVSEAPMNFLRNMELEKLPGLEALKGFLGRIMEFFKEGTPEAKKLTDVVGKMTNSLFGGLKNITKDDLVRFFDKGVIAAEELRKTIDKTWLSVEKLMHGDSSEFLAASQDALFSAGKFIGQGLLSGVLNGLSAGGPGMDRSGKKSSDPVVNAMAGTTFPVGLGDLWHNTGGAADRIHAGGTLGQLKHTLNWVLRNEDIYGNKLGGLPAAPAVPAASAAGFPSPLDGLPKFARGGIADRPTAGIFGDAGPEAILPLEGAGPRLRAALGLGPPELRGSGSGGGASITIAAGAVNVTISMNSGSGDASGDSARAASFGTAVKDALIEALRDVAQSSGAPEGAQKEAN